ncbi:Uncharacterised protein [Vibrio cholerae]|nr:Uncharacterised protein [Vibrio cholerae]
MSGFSALSLKYCCIIGVWCERDSLGEAFDFIIILCRCLSSSVQALRHFITRRAWVT